MGLELRMDCPLCGEHHSVFLLASYTFQCRGCGIKFSKVKKGSPPSDYGQTLINAAAKTWQAALIPVKVIQTTK